MNIISNNGKLIIKEDPINYTKDGYVQVDLILYNNEYLTFNIEQELKKIIKIPIERDGLINITHILILSKDRYNTYKDELSKSEQYVFYYDDGFYKAALENKEYIESKLTLEEFCTLIELYGKKYIKYSEKYISTWFLKQCYIDLCKLIFDQRGYQPCFKSNVNDDLIYKRDLLWMALNVIEYYTKIDETIEAKRIIELINGCNGICNEISLNNIKNCGCNK